MSYRVVTLDLSNVIADDTPAIIVDEGQVISEVAILDLPVNTTIKLSFGANPLFQVSNPITFQPRGEDEQGRGMKWANPVAQPGVKVEVIVASGGVTGARVQ